MRYDFDIREVSRGQALDMITAYHYSDTLPKINRHFLGCFLGVDLVGVVTLGLGTRPRHTIQRLFPSLGSHDYLEIGRMCMTDDMPRNSESQMLSRVVAWIRANEPGCKVLFTWADGIMGKPGYVYQACSFWYAGFVEGEIYERDGCKLHVRGMKSLLTSDPNDRRLTVRPTLEQMRELGIRHYKGRQFRYVKLTCGRRERARLLAESLVPLTTDYPKDRDLAWREIDRDTGRWHECGRPDIRTDRREGAPQLQRALF